MGILVSVFQVGLQDDPEVRVVAELVLGEEFATDVEREVLDGVVFHVDVDVGAGLHRFSQQRPQEVFRHRFAALGGDGVEAGVDRGQLDRDVHARDRHAVALVAQRDLRPGRGLPGQLRDQVEVGLVVGVRFFA